MSDRISAIKTVTQQDYLLKNLPWEITLYPGIYYRFKGRLPFNIKGQTINYSNQTDCVFTVDKPDKVTIDLIPAFAGTSFKDFITMLGSPEGYMLPGWQGVWIYSDVATWSTGISSLAAHLPKINSNFYCPIRTILIDEISARRVNSANNQMHNSIYSVRLNDEDGNQLYLINNPVMSGQGIVVSPGFYWKAETDQQALIVPSEITGQSGASMEIAGNTDGAISDTLNFTIKYRIL